MQNIKTVKSVKLEEAKEIADKIIKQLAPYCNRIEVAGDIRGKRKEVEIIEIVAIPKICESGGLNEGLLSIINKWKKIEDCFYYNFTERMLPSGIKLKLHFAQTDNWGLIQILSTGNGEYIYRCIAAGWSIYGYEFTGNHLCKGNKKIVLLEEEDLFNLIEKPYEEPELRYL